MHINYPHLGYIQCLTPSKIEDMSILEPLSPSCPVHNEEGLKTPKSMFKFPEDANVNWEGYPSPIYADNLGTPTNKEVFTAYDNRLAPPEINTQILSPKGRGLVFPSYSPSSHFQHYYSPKHSQTAN